MPSWRRIDTVTAEREQARCLAYPWGRHALSDRLSVWGVVGYGEGSLTLTPEGQAPMETDMDLTMAGAGLRSVMVEAPAEGGLELAAKSDGFVVRTSSDRVEGLAAASAEVTRLRLGLEGSWRGGQLVPSVEIGVRHDGGDAETGFGADIGAGLSWSDPASGISAEVRGRGLLTHDDGGFRERGFAGSLAWDPRRSPPRRAVARPDAVRNHELIRRWINGFRRTLPLRAAFQLRIIRQHLETLTRFPPARASALLAAALCVTAHKVEEPR